MIKPTIRVLFVLNNSPWNKVDDKLAEISKWFNSTINLTCGYVHTKYENIPFTTYDNGEGTPQTYGVDPDWYDRFVTPLGIGYDIVLLVLPRRQWQEPNRARGWRSDYDQGPVQLQIGCDENDTSRDGGWTQFGRKMSAFFLLSEHEIMHALFMITGQPDTTHYWWNLGKLEMALKELVFAPNFQLPMYQRVLNYLQGQLAKLITTMPNQTPKKSLVEAIIQVESGGDINAIGDKHLTQKAYGCMQIRQPAVDDVNRVFNTKHKAQDMLGSCPLSRWVFDRYMDIYATTKQIGRPVTDQDRARIWNGGPTGWKRSSTVGYWNKVKALM